MRGGTAVVVDWAPVAGSLAHHPSPRVMLIAFLPKLLEAGAAARVEVVVRTTRFLERIVMLRLARPALFRPVVDSPVHAALPADC